MNGERFLSALAAFAITAAAVVAAAKLSTDLFELYGWSLYLAAPLMCGAAASLIHNRRSNRSAKESMRVALFAGGFSLGTFLLMGFEGLICIAMTAPVALPLFVAGGYIGFRIRGALKGGKSSDAASLILLAFVPFLMGFEASLARSPKERQVSTAVTIAGDASEVWREVVAFSPIPEPTDWIFRMGIAYPTSARIDGVGVGAIRYCSFSTGDFIEPITAWVENERLAFDVAEQPMPMTEISPYAGVSPPHLDWVFRSTRGEFTIQARADGTVELVGTTWYELAIEPKFYWGWLSDQLVHAIHHRVLEHIKRAVESGARSRVTAAAILAPPTAYAPSACAFARRYASTGWTVTSTLILWSPPPVTAPLSMLTSPKSRP